MNFLPKISLIIFDLDDTLIKSNINYNLMKDQLKSLFTESFDPNTYISVNNLLELLAEKHPEKVDLGYELIQNLESSAILSAEIIPFADLIPNLLYELNITNSAILTNNSATSVNNYLSNPKFSFLTLFGPIFTRDTVKKMKPHPDGLLEIIKKFDLLEKRKEVLYIGDSIIDSEAARNAGIRFVFFNSRGINLDSIKPWKTITGLSELRSLLQNELLDCII